MKKNLPAKFLTPNLFNEYTYSKRRHFNIFLENNYDQEMFGRKIDPDFCDLKVYQDLFMMSYILQNIEPGSKILDVGGGASRILSYFKDTMECWNIDKLEGMGNGPVDDQFEREGYKLVYDYMGNFNEELPNDYFDLVFSISTLEHVPEELKNYENVLMDINRVLKPGGYSVNCIDVVWHSENVFWTNPILLYFFEKEKIINKFIPFSEVIQDPDIFFMAEKYYSEKWQSATHKPYSEFGKPLSYNFLWKKENVLI
ncbi:MAG: methyltransferase domain-containing protein [bacterium]